MNTIVGNSENPISEVSDTEALAIEPLVSVVMITYNHEKYLAQAIESVLTQKTDFPVELIIGEDCSTDQTRALALAYQNRYPERIRIRFPERNLGVMPNFIGTLEAARGKYIALCEGDDYWCDERKLQKQVAILEDNPRFYGVFHDCYRLNEKTKQSKIRIGNIIIDKNPDLASIIREKHIPTASILYRKINFSERHVKLLESVRQGDYMLSMIVAEHGPWQYLSEPMSVYRIHDGGVWSGDRAVNIAKADIEFYDILLSDSVFSKFEKLVQQKRSDSVRRLAQDYAICGEFIRSILYYLKSIGPKNELSGQYISAKKFWKVFFRELTTKLDSSDRLRNILRKLIT